MVFALKELQPPQVRARSVSPVWTGNGLLAESAGALGADARPKDLGGRLCLCENVPQRVLLL